MTGPVREIVPGRRALRVLSWWYFGGVKAPVALLLSGVLAIAPTRAAQAAAGPEGSERQIAVLPLRVEGSANDATKKEWFAGVRRGIGRGELRFVDQAKVDQIGDVSCERKACLDKLRSSLQATHFVRTTVSIKNRDYAVKLEVVDTSTGEVIVSAEERCEICGVEEVTNLLDAQGALLQTRLSSMGAEAPLLAITSDPPGAVVYIDDQAVGTTPLERPVLEGSHRVRVTLDGYVAEERQLNFVAGVREQAAFSLRRTPGNPKKRILGGVAIGGGVVLIGAGIGLMAAQIPYRGNCNEENGTKDAMGNCKFLLNTSWGGATMAIAGAVLVTVGIIALRRNRGAKATKQAHVLPTGLGLMGRF